MKCIDNLNWRYATKKFDSTKLIPEEVIKLIKETITLSPSSYGLQPWKIKIINNKTIQKKLLKYSYNQEQVVDASHLLIICRPSSYTHKEIDSFVLLNKQIREGLDPSANYAGFEIMLKNFIDSRSDIEIDHWMKNQSYLLLGQLLLTFAELRIDSCPMEGFQPEKYDQILGLDQLNIKSTLICPIGYRSNKDSYGKLPKVRYPINHYFL